jgi:hypothetical protein
MSYRKCTSSCSFNYEYLWNQMRYWIPLYFCSVCYKVIPRTQKLCSAPNYPWTVTYYKDNAPTPFHLHNTDTGNTWHFAPAPFHLHVRHSTQTPGGTTRVTKCWLSITHFVISSIKKGMLSQQFVTHVVPPLHKHHKSTWALSYKDTNTTYRTKGYCTQQYLLLSYKGHSQTSHQDVYILPYSCFFSLSTHTHKQTHTHIHTHTHTNKHTYTHTNKHTHTYTHKHTH